MPSGSLLLQAAALGILTGGVYALLASGLTLIFGVMRVVHISHAAFLILAAYLSYFAYTLWGIDPLVSMFGTVPLFFVGGYLIQRLLLARLNENVTMMSVLLTFAFAISIEGLIGYFWTSSFRSVTVDYASTAIELAGVRLPTDRLIGFAVAAVTLGLLLAILRFTKYGRALRATIQHPQAAQLIGVDTGRVTGFGFGLGLATTAAGGAILALIMTFFPAAHYGWIARLMAIIVVGGLGSIPGAAIAALLMGLVESLALVLIDATWAAMMFYIALFGVLIVRPQGFFGGRLAERF